MISGPLTKVRDGIDVELAKSRTPATLIDLTTPLTAYDEDPFSTVEITYLAMWLRPVSADVPAAPPQSAG